MTIFQHRIPAGKGLLLGGSLLALCTAAPAFAQDIEAEAEAASQSSGNNIIVTATRRSETVQDIPLNIAAIGSEQIEEQGLDELADLLAFVPGINVVDRGGRQGNPIIVRGLNVDPLGSGDGNNDGGGTVATYLGEVPVFIDLKLNDLERVEVLLGPQGTLYGAGTLGGAIRYIPMKPQFNEITAQVRGEGYQYSQAESISYGAGATINFGLTDTLAIRGSIDWQDDSGFIDYVNVVDEPGVTNPNTPAGLNRIEDADGEQTLSGRVALRWQPTPALDATLTYYYQKADIEGRRTSHWRSDVPGLLDGTQSVGRYENAFLVREPNTIENDLLALEVTADLGFAELTSATGWSNFSDDGQRDQTTLLITLEYSYELFPSFTAFTREVGRQERINQELRLVSTHGGPFQWIIGGFYNRLESWGSSSEFTPNYVQFTLDAGTNVGQVDRPDALEYFSFSNSRLEEMAVYGEASYELFDQFTITLGGRYYDYKLEAVADDVLPLFEGLDYVPLGLDEISQLAFDPALAQADDGFLFKVNAAWEVNPDLLLYATVSEGFRVGASNGRSSCPDFDPTSPTQQTLCALAPGQEFAPGGPGNVSLRDERQYTPDTTRNYEIGFKSTLAEGAMTLNGALFYIDWQDPQLTSATVNGNLPITVNGDGAQSKGFELSANWFPTDRINIRGSFSHTKAELTADVPALIRTISTPGFGTAFEDGLDGDRLPGSPETQIALFGSYDHPLKNGDSLIFNASWNWQSNVFSRTGARGDSLILDSYGVTNASISYEAENFSVSLFARNLFDAFAETGVVGTRLNNQDVFDNDGNPVYVRGFSTNILPPFSAGVRFTVDFGG